MRAASGVVVLGIDVGTTNTKATLVRVSPDADEPVVELATARSATPDDAVALVATVGRVVTEVLDRHPHERPAAVGIASMAETGVALDARGTPLTALLRWDGHRAGEHVEHLTRVHGAESLFAATGVRPSAKVPLATWSRLAAEGIRLHRWAGVADLVAAAFTGRLVTDHTLAGRTMAYRATADGGPPTAFDPDLLATVGLTPEQLPEVVAPDAVAGHARDRGDRRAAGTLAHSLRLDGLVASGTPVVVAGHDHAVGAWAAGVRDPGDRADSVGTAEAVLTVLDRGPAPVPVARAGMSWVRTVGGRHAVQAGSSSAGAMLGWLEPLVPGGLAPALSAAARLDPNTGPVVLPYLAGRQTPDPDPRAAVAVVELDGTRLGPGEVRALGEREPGRLALAVLLGACLQARWMLEVQGTLGHDGDLGNAGAPRVLGGPVRSIDAWARTKHRVTPEGLSLVLADEPVAVGAALLAAARAGLLGEPAPALRSAPSLTAQALGPPADVIPEAVLQAFVRAATAPPGPG